MSEHQVEVRYSVDGGHNWSNWRIGDMGATGRFDKPPIFRRFGSGRDFVMQIRVSGPIRAHLMAVETMDHAGAT